MFWAKLAFNGTAATRRMLQKAWRKQVVRVGKAKRPWAKVAGPAGAVTLYLKHLDWISTSATSWVTDEGVHLDLRKTAPSSTKQLIEAAVERTLWRSWASKARTAEEEQERKAEEANSKRKWTSQERLSMIRRERGGYRTAHLDWKPWGEEPQRSVGGHPPRHKTADPEGLRREPSGYWFPELRKWTNGSKKNWSDLEAACFTSVVCGSQWGQERLFNTGFVDHPLCFTCLRGPGTPEHRAWECKALRAMREQGIDKEIVEEAREDLKVDPNHPLWTRGLFPMRDLPTIPPIAAQQTRWFREQEEGCLTGNLYTDGSLRLLSWWPEASRAGWGVAGLDGITLTYGLFGNLPGPI